jgi:hypothetical protein
MHITEELLQLQLRDLEEKTVFYSYKVHNLSTSEYRRLSRREVGDEISKSRIETLTDGVFAVVMTLLVLEIAIPQLSG